MGLIDVDKWRAVWNGVFSYSIIERERYWTYDDDVDFKIACQIKRLSQGNGCPLLGN